MSFFTKSWGVCLGLLLCSAWAAAQDDVIGYVKTVTGGVTVISAGRPSAALPGMALRKGDVLKTASNASVGVTLKDSTVLSSGPDSEVAIDDYAYAPSQDALKLSLRMSKGTLHYISGVIAKLRPEAVDIKTPTGIIGVRGTEFAVLVDPKDAP